MFLPDAWLENKVVEIIRRAIKHRTLVLLWIAAITKLFSFSS